MKTCGLDIVFYRDDYEKVIPRFGDRDCLDQHGSWMGI